MISIYWLLLNLSPPQGSPWQRWRGRTDLWEVENSTPPPRDPAAPFSQADLRYLSWPPSAASQAAPLLTVRSSAWLRARRRCDGVSTAVSLHAAKTTSAVLFTTNALRCGLHSLGSTLSEERLHPLRVQKNIYICVHIYSIERMLCQDEWNEFMSNSWRTQVYLGISQWPSSRGRSCLKWRERDCVTLEETHSCELQRVKLWLNLT